MKNSMSSVRCNLTPGHLHVQCNLPALVPFSQNAHRFTGGETGFVFAAVVSPAVKDAVGDDRKDCAHPHAVQSADDKLGGGFHFDVGHLGGCKVAQDVIRK